MVLQVEVTHAQYQEIRKAWINAGGTNIEDEATVEPPEEGPAAAFEVDHARIVADIVGLPYERLSNTPFKLKVMRSRTVNPTAAPSSDRLKITPKRARNKPPK